MAKRVVLSLSVGVYKMLENEAKKLGKPPATLARELLETEMRRLGMFDNLQSRRGSADKVTV